MTPDQIVRNYNSEIEAARLEYEDALACAAFEMALTFKREGFTSSSFDDWVDN